MLTPFNKPNTHTHTHTHTHIHKQQQQQKQQQLDDWQRACWDLVGNMMAESPKLRPSAEQALHRVESIAAATIKAGKETAAAAAAAAVAVAPIAAAGAIDSAVVPKGLRS